MSFPAYSEYKDSGILWLGKYPSHWDLKPLWTCYSRTKRTGFDGEELLSVYRDYGVIPKSSRDDNFNKPSDDLSTYQLVEPSDLVINKMKAWQGSVAVSEYRGIVSPAYHVYRAHHDANSKYLHHLMRSPQYIAGYLSLSKGIRVNQWDLEPQYHSRMPLVIPPIGEQNAIASFLELETSTIDALVAEQQRLIELLQEKRQAVISHAVTKGLNPDVPMKASGIEWLGDVPQHWSVSKAKRVASVFVPQRNKPELNDSGNGVCWITMEQMQNPEILDSPLYVSEEASANAGSKVLKSGAVIASCVGQFEVATINRVDVIINQQLQAYIPGPDINPEYLRLLILLSTSYFEQTGTAATIVYVNQKGFDELPVAVPPMGEQRAIVDYLDVQSGTLSRLQTEAVRAIELLRERRTALISAAVTGKIDVRGLAGKASA